MQPTLVPAIDGGGTNGVRTPLSQLLAEHRATVEALQAELGDDLLQGPPPGDPLAYDEVWLLRYVLSFGRKGGLPAAAGAARKALAWRRENVDLISAAASRRPPPSLSRRTVAAFSTFSVAGFHKSSVYGDLIFHVRTSCSDLPRLMDELGSETVAYLMTYCAECGYQYLNAVSRECGYLVKTLNIMDLTSTAWVYERRFFAALSIAGKRHEWLYPQKDAKTVIFRPPRWVGWAFNLFKTFMPRSAMEKAWIHSHVPAFGEPGCDMSLCPYASRLLAPGRIPVTLGGYDEEGATGLPSRCTTTWAQRHPSLTWHSAGTGGPRDGDVEPEFSMHAIKLLPSNTHDEFGRTRSDTPEGALNAAAATQHLPVERPACADICAQRCRRFICCTRLRRPTPETGTRLLHRATA